tara:strand:- start:156 stop:1568 length:1413 start_codon:yes stop_codon:yes gene_type:complete
MAITIPSGARNTFKKVLGAMGGEDYSYYLFDVTNIAAKPGLKVQVGLKVYIPLSQRSTAVHNVQSSLDGDDIVSVIKDEKQLDVSIEGADKGQVIRLLFKPEGSKGSGGGSAATAIQEAAQCVYAAIRYYCGDVENISEDDLKCGMKYSDIPGVKLEDIMGLPKEWKDSSWEGAKEIKRKIEGDGWTFVRGDNKIEKQISEAFKRVKKQTNLSSEDKWNPADIWMVQTNKIDAIAAKLKKEGTIDCLNNYIQQSRADGDLIGISLKKIEGSPTMKLLNDDDAATRKQNESAHFAKYDLTFDNKRKKDPYPMDVYFYYGSGTFQKFQARNFGGPSKGDWKLELKGKSAAQGKVQGAVLRKLLDNAGFNVTKLTEPNFNDCAPGKGVNKQKITDDIYELLKKFKAKNFVDELNTKNIIASQPKAWRYSKLAGLRMLKWLDDLPNGEADKAMKELYLYASSQSDKSSVYWKLS